jgi:putative membrane protein
MYEIIKVLHIISVICWFAGLFYLPRLFVYHVNCHDNSTDMLKTMERKLFNYIMKPSLIATWIFGVWLLYLTPEWYSDGWIHLKLICVIILSTYHYKCGKFVKVFEKNKNTKAEKYYRYFNEIPSVLLIIIVFLVVLKPF